jgi:hypothetical protein
MVQGERGTGELEVERHAADMAVPWVAHIPAAPHRSLAARILAAPHTHQQRSDLGVLPAGLLCTTAPSQKLLENASSTNIDATASTSFSTETANYPKIVAVSRGLSALGSLHGTLKRRGLGAAISRRWSPLGGEKRG